MDTVKMNQLATDLSEVRARSNMYDLVTDLEKNIAAEAEARREYYSLLEYWYDDLESEEIEQIKEIIAEELKHTEILRDMIEKKTKIIAKD